MYDTLKFNKFKSREVNMREIEIISQSADQKKIEVVIKGEGSSNTYHLLLGKIKEEKKEEIKEEEKKEKPAWFYRAPSGEIKVFPFEGIPFPKKENSEKEKSEKEKEEN